MRAQVASALSILRRFRSLTFMQNTARIFVAGHRGMVGSAIVRRLQSAGYTLSLIHI